jgi:O-antigen ligase
MQVKEILARNNLCNILLFLFPLLIVTVPKAYGLLGAMLLLASLTSASWRLEGLSKEDWIFIGLVLLYPCYLLIDFLIRGSQWGGVDYSMRALACAILVWAWRDKTRSSRFLLTGIVLGAVWAMFLALYQSNFCISNSPYLTGLANQAFYCGVDQGRPGGMTNPIPFAQIMAVFSMLLIIWRHNLSRILLLIGVGAALMALFLSGTRGAMLGLLFAGLVLSMLTSRWHWKKAAIIATLTLMAFGGIASSAWLQQKMRIVEFRVDIARFAQGDANTSSGIRLTLWQSAWQAFEENPAVGLGSGQFSSYLKHLVEQKRAPVFVGEFGHAHNQYLETLANNGLLGLAALLISMLGSGWMFLRRCALGQNTSAALSGLGLIVITLVFNLTQPMYAHHIAVVFYFLMLAVFWHLSSPRYADAE